MLLSSLQNIIQQAGRVATRTTIKGPVFMPLVNPSLILGGAVAAFIVVAKYPVRGADTPTQRAQKRTVAFLLTFLPGIIVAQTGLDIAMRQWPILGSIPSAPLGVGLLFGGCGLPLVLGVYKRLPGVLLDRATGFLGGGVETRPTQQSTTIEPDTQGQ